MQGSFFRAADPNKGRFRTFLLTALEHFLSKESRQRRTLKRGGACHFFSLNDESVENRYRLEPEHGESPERLFERGWALAVLDEAMSRLAGECSTVERKAVFDQLSPLIGGERGDSTRAQLAARLGLSENALNLSLLRLRRRYGELIRDVIAGTVSNPKEVEEELRFLMQAVRQ